jgi:hypothetical protein
VTPVYVRSVGQVLGILAATATHAAVALLPARGRARR